MIYIMILELNHKVSKSISESIGTSKINSSKVRIPGLTDELSPIEDMKNDTLSKVRDYF